MRPPRIDWFSFFVGMYLAMPVVGIGAVLFGWTIVESSVICVGIVVSIAVSVAEYVPGLPRYLARSWLHSVVIAVPTVAIFAFALLVSTGIVPIRSSDVIMDLLVLAGFGLAGLGMHIAADNRLASHVRSNESALIEWNFSPSDNYVRRIRIIYIVIGVMLFVGGFALVMINQVYEAATLLPTLGGVITVQAFILGRSKDATAFESGLAIHRPGVIHTAFIPWDRFTGYERTDEELVIQRRLPLTSIHFDLTDIEDVDAVEEKLHTMINENV